MDCQDKMDYQPERGYRRDDRGRVTTNILSVYKWKPTFSGLSGEDIEAVSENYLETAQSCEATDK